MATPDDLEAHLVRLDRRFEKRDHTFIVSLGPNQPPAAVRVEAPVVVVEVDVGPAPGADDARSAKLFRSLLELNATDLVHVAYAVQHGRIVLESALDAESLDLRDVEATLADLDLAVAEHVPRLRALSRPA